MLNVDLFTKFSKDVAVWAKNMRQTTETSPLWKKSLAHVFVIVCTFLWLQIWFGRLNVIRLNFVDFWIQKSGTEGPRLNLLKLF